MGERGEAVDRVGAEADEAPMTAWLHRFPTPAEVAAHSAAHPPLPRHLLDDRNLGGRWLFRSCEEPRGLSEVPLLTTLRVEAGAVEYWADGWQAMGEEGESGWWWPCTAEGARLPEERTRRVEGGVCWRQCGVEWRETGEE